MNISTVGHISSWRKKGKRSVHAALNRILNICFHKVPFLKSRTKNVWFNLG